MTKHFQVSPLTFTAFFAVATALVALAALPLISVASQIVA